MDKQEVYDWLRQDIELTIAFDTSAIFLDHMRNLKTFRKLILNR